MMMFLLLLRKSVPLLLFASLGVLLSLSSSVLALSPLSVGTASVHDARSYQQLAEQSWNKITSDGSSSNNKPSIHAGDHRQLKRGDGNDGFGRVCHEFITEFHSMARPGTSCQCKMTSQSVICEIPPQCNSDDSQTSMTVHCPNPVCVMYTVQLFVKKVDLSSSRGRDTSLLDNTVHNDDTAAWMMESLNVLAKYTGTAYKGERMVSTVDKCQQSFIIGDTEFECNSCQFCPNGGILLDCTNIQPRALTMGGENGDETCLVHFDSSIPSSTTAGSGPHYSFDYCPAGGAPEPTTAGQPFSENTMGDNQNDFEAGKDNENSSSSAGLHWIVAVLLVVMTVTPILLP